MVKTMKSILFTLLLAAGSFALPASACEQSEHTGMAVAQPDSTRELFVQAIFQASGQDSETHRCDCPVFADGAASAVIEPKKALDTADVEGISDVLVPSFVELQLVLEVRDRHLAASSPPSVFPLYLLTARLRR